jgi:hypothetical protein
MIRALAFVIVALLLPMQVSAADIQVVDIRAEGWTLGIFGEIVEGDADKARALVGNKTLKSTAEMGELMRQRGLPEAWIGAMERTSPRRMTFLTPDDILVGTDSAVLTFARLSIATYFGM